MRIVERILEKVILFIDGAAAIFLAIVTALTFVAVVVRYGFAGHVPGTFDIGRLLLGVAIFWGVAVAAYGRKHIQVDILWLALPDRAKGLVNLFADLVFLAFMSVLAVMFWRQTMMVMRSREVMFELPILVWPFYFLAWLGVAMTVLVLFARLVRVVLKGELDVSGGEKPEASVDRLL